MKKLIIGAIAFGAVIVGAVAVMAAPDVTLSGVYVPISNPNMSNDVVGYEIDGNRAGRDLAVHHQCDNGDDIINRVYWDSNKHATVNFGVYTPVTECTGVVIDLDDNSVVSNTVTVTP